MSSSKNAVARFFGTPSKAFLPGGLAPASSRILALALVVGAAATVDIRSEAVAAPQAYGATAQQQSVVSPELAERAARAGRTGVNTAQGVVPTRGQDATRPAPSRAEGGAWAGRTGMNTAQGLRPIPAPDASRVAPVDARALVFESERGYERRPGLLGGIKGALERRVDRVVDGAYERRERRIQDGYGYGVPVPVPVYGAGAYGYGAPPPVYVQGDVPLRRDVAVVLDRQSGDYVFGAGRGALRVGKDVVENIHAAAQTTGADPALVMALSWRSGAAAETGALPNSGVRVAGMFAYSEQRFLEEMTRWGGSLGVGDQVSSIRRTPEGALVAVGHARDTFEGMRHDIHASAVVGAANVKSAQAHLDQAAPGRHGAADVLVAVQFGNDVAVNLITARMTNPHKPMTGPLADVVAGMGLPAVDAGGRAWTISSFHEATEMRLREEMHAFSPMRSMQLAEQHRPVSPQSASYPNGPRL